MIASRFFLLLCALTLSAPTAFADDAPLSDPKEILTKCRDALRKCETVSYDITIEATEWLQQFVPQVRGKAVVGPLAEYDVPRFRCEVELQKAGSEEKLDYKAGCDGKDYYLIDPRTKKAHYDLDPVVLGSDGRNIQRALLAEFTAKEPLKDELESSGAELRGIVEVGGEKCYEVFVPLSSSSPKSVTWAISVKDYLPRRAARVYANRRSEGPDGLITTTLTNLKPNPKLDRDPFKLVVPDGYEKTDDFAP